MLFSSLTFLFCFLPAVVGLYSLVRRELRNIVLLLASVFFYAWGEVRYLPIIFMTIGISYAGAIFIERFKHKKLWLTLFILLDLSLLFYFRNITFIVSNETDSILCLSYFVMKNTCTISVYLPKVRR